MAFAGIPKTDERGQTIDVHALRRTFGTHLSEAGVAPRTAQAAMRHSSIDLTMNVYTDPKLLDVHGAIEQLPALPIDGTGDESEAATAPMARLIGLYQGLYQTLTIDAFLVNCCQLVRVMFVTTTIRRAMT